MIATLHTNALYWINWILPISGQEIKEVWFMNVGGYLQEALITHEDIQ